MKVRLALALVGALLVAGVSYLIVVGGSEDRPFTIAIGQEPDSLNWMLSNMLAATEIERLIQAPLFDWDDSEPWAQIPVIAREIPTTENGQVKFIEGVANDPPPPAPVKMADESDEDFQKRVKAHPDELRAYRQKLALIDADGDGRHTEIDVTWRIRPDAVWADGVPVTAEDFKLAREFVLSKKWQFPVPSSDPYDRMRSITSIEDGRAFVVRWKEPYAFYNKVGLASLPAHAIRDALDREGKNFQKNPWNRAPLGSGPYRVVQWVPRQRLLLEANPNWWGEKPKIKRIQYIVVTDTKTIPEQLRGGQADATAETGVQFDEALNFSKLKVPGFKTYFVPGLTWEHIDINQDHWILKDIRVRQALLLATDRATMTKALFEGKQAVAHTWLPPKHPGYNPEARKYSYDPEASKALLEAAGWKLREGETVRQNAEGKPLSLTLITTAGNKVRQSVQELIQQMWRKVGIDLKLETMDASTYFGKGGPLNKRKFELGMYAWIFGPVSDGVSNWTTAGIPSKDNGWQGQNYAGMRDPELGRLDRLIPVTLDDAQRIEYFKQEQARWVEVLPALPLYFRTGVTITRDALEQWRPTGGGSRITWNATSWALPQ